MAAEDVTVYWRPNCSSCMRVKEYLARCGIAFRSVNVLEEPQALHEQRARDARQAVLQVVEPVAAEQQLAQDQQRPAFGEDLRRLRHRAELAVLGHGPTLRRRPPSRAGARSNY